MSKNKLAFGAIIGVAAGLVAGLLLAPKSGRSTRADLKKKAKELKQTTRGSKKAPGTKGKNR